MSTDDTEARSHDAGPTGQGDSADHPPASADESAAADLLAIDEDDGESPDRSRRVLRRVLISVGIIGLVLAVVIGGGLWFLTERYAGNVHRITDAFAGLNEDQRPAPATAATPAGADPVTFLLVGSDTREKTAPGADPGARSDAIMIARFSGDRQHAQLISIPRDSWVDIPGHGKNKINASYAFGGPSLLIQTVEQLTQVRIDHYVAIDFDGIIKVTDDLGGVDVVLAEQTSNGPYTFQKGVNHLNGDEARWYLGQRYGLEGGDFDRVKRQQQYLRAMFGKLFSANTFTDVGKLDSALRAVTSAVSVDDTLGNTALLKLASSMRGVTPDDIQYFTAPIEGTGKEGPASVVYLNDALGERMWQFLRNDSLAENAEEFSQQALPDVPR